MNIIRKRLLHNAALALVIPLAALFLAACDVDSVDSTTAVPSDGSGTIYNFAGLYARVDTNGMQAPLVFPLGRQSGTTITWLRLLQYGSRIEAYDNAGMTWAGSISTIDAGTANFSLRGRTTAGLSTEIAGALRLCQPTAPSWMPPGSSPPSPAASSPSPPYPRPTRIRPSPACPWPPTPPAWPSTESSTLTASGGTGSYTWSVERRLRQHQRIRQCRNLHPHLRHERPTRPPSPSHPEAPPVPSPSFSTDPSMNKPPPKIPPPLPHGRARG
jgi:hypothetical protein